LHVIYDSVLKSETDHVSHPYKTNCKVATLYITTTIIIIIIIQGEK